VAISPQVPEKSAETKNKHGLDFPVLSDEGLAYARRLNLVYRVPDDLREVYTQFDIVLPRFNGDDSWELPLSARLVVGSDGVIRDVEADVDYTRRPEPEDTVEALRELEG